MCELTGRTPGTHRPLRGPRASRAAHHSDRPGRTRARRSTARTDARGRARDSRRGAAHRGGLTPTAEVGPQTRRAGKARCPPGSARSWNSASEKGAGRTWPSACRSTRCTSQAPRGGHSDLGSARHCSASAEWTGPPEGRGDVAVVRRCGVARNRAEPRVASREAANVGSAAAPGPDAVGPSRGPRLAARVQGGHAHPERLALWQLTDGARLHRTAAGADVCERGASAVAKHPYTRGLRHGRASNAHTIAAAPPAA
jgi:hypothetical protein